MLHKSSKRKVNQKKKTKETHMVCFYIRCTKKMKLKEKEKTKKKVQIFRWSKEHRFNSTKVKKKNCSDFVFEI